MLKAKSIKLKALKAQVCHPERSEGSGAMQGQLANAGSFVPQHHEKYLSAFAFLLAFSVMLSAFSSCSLNPNMQGKGQLYMQGEWQQDTSAMQQKLVTFSRYSMKFDCDSFFVQMHNTSKVNYGSDTCMRSGHWAEYVKGAYMQRNDTVFLKGQFCNADFSFKSNTDCFRVGPYEEFFKVSKKTDSLIQLTGTSNIIPIDLHLIKRTSCTQKPL